MCKMTVVCILLVMYPAINAGGAGSKQRTKPSTHLSSADRALNRSIDKDKEVLTIYDAAAQGNLVALRSIVAQCKDINVRNDEDKTPLYYAAERGQVESFTYSV